MRLGCSLVILAGGRSRRMGRDKAALPTRDGTMVAHLAGRLAAVVEEVIVAGPAMPALEDVRRVDDHYPGFGPLAGIHAGLLAARSPWVWVVGCDLPDVEPALAPLLLSLAEGYDAVIPCLDGEPQGVCALYDRSLAARAEAVLQTGERSIKSLLRRCQVRYVSPQDLQAVDPELRSFRNLNTPAEYEAWLRASGAG